MPLHKVVFPAIGEEITEASIIRWLVSEGDKIDVNQPLVEIAADKLHTQLRCPCEGIIRKIVTQAGEMPKAGEIIVFIQSGEDDTSFVNKQETTSSKIRRKPQKPIIQPDQNTERGPFVPPTIRLLVLKMNVNLDSLIRFSQKKEGEIITKTDFEYYLKARSFSSESNRNA